MNSPVPVSTSKLAQELQIKMAELQNALLKSLPEMPTILQTIHTALKADPEQVTLLSDEETAALVTGLMRHTNVEIAAKVAKKTTTKSLKNASLADLGLD